MRKQRKQVSRKGTRGAKSAAVLVAAGVLLPTAGASTAGAVKRPQADVDGNYAVCEFTAHVKLVGHGLSVLDLLAGATGDRTTTFESDRGSANCTGQINNHTVYGSGPATIAGSYEAAPLCVRGVGTGAIEMSVPRLLTFFGQQYESLQGSFGLDLSGADWRTLGDVTDEASVSSAFAAVSHFTADAGLACKVHAGTLSGRLVIGGTSSQRADAVDMSSVTRQGAHASERQGRRG